MKVMNACGKRLRNGNGAKLSYVEISREFGTLLVVYSVKIDTRYGKQLL